LARGAEETGLADREIPEVVPFDWQTAINQPIDLNSPTDAP
jgi:hypothetical protein